MRILLYVCYIFSEHLFLRVPLFILLGGLGGTLLAVSILGMVCIVYDCHLWPVLQCWGVINSSSVYYGFFLYWEWSFQFCGGAYGLCLKSRAQRRRLSYPAGKLQWCFTCVFKFRHSLWLPFVAGFAALKGLLIVSVGTLGYFLPGDKGTLMQIWRSTNVFVSI